jgi:hypothetical protein
VVDILETYPPRGGVMANASPSSTTAGAASAASARGRSSGTAPWKIL